MSILFFCLSLITPVDSWVPKQVEVLKKQEVSNPAEQAKALFSLVFVTRRVTADDTTSPSDWGRVTSDGSVRYPIAVDPWDLADRMRQIAEGLDWSVKMAECDLGPIMVFGEEGTTTGNKNTTGKPHKFCRQSQRTGMISF